MKINKITPVLVVDAVEPALACWEALGFEATVRVPHGDAVGFAILVRGDHELMLQSQASLAADLPAVAERNAGVLYLDVDALPAAPPGEVLIRERTTFYGARETWVRVPGGQVLGFAVH
ncbi:MAG TPA: hypothetical protein VM734_19840 [Kofleriaceae bacterium]|nr:hypothetical protein [Kofleriaceae bacterium]